MKNPLIKPFPCKEEFVITPKQLNNIDDTMLKTGAEEILAIEIDITDISENQRDNLQKILKEKFHVLEPVSIGRRLILSICKIQDERRSKNGSSDYIQFALYTETMRTEAAIDRIAKKLRYFYRNLDSIFLSFLPFFVGNYRKSSACFMTAEKKFAKSITQLVTVKREDSIGLGLISDKQISIGHLSFAPKPLQLGDLNVSLNPS